MDANDLAERILAEHAATLKVGTKVEIRDSGECENLWCKRITGITGYIIGILPPMPHPKWDQHDYRVWDGKHVRSGYYAASELIPEHAPAGPERGEETT